MDNNFVKYATNFLIAEFCILYFQTADTIQSKWNVGSGCWNPLHPMDALLMTLTQLKQEQPYVHTLRVFGCGLDGFCHLVEIYVIACDDGFADYFINQPSMGHYQTNSLVFDHFPDAIKAIDITFQHSHAQDKYYAAKTLLVGKAQGNV